ncbi:hypothetical protein sos41_22890 [Alphaproteobacteria bacterium SO-S41]|nr:hypothetical protein sos41_22890 [Alphaproteobacteria bacterium SO-S41]
MTDKETKFACLISDTTLHFDFPYGDVSANLCIRKSPRWGNDVILSVSKGQFLCKYDGCSVRVRFDKNAVATYSVLEPSDNSTTSLFVQGFDKFVSRTRKADVTIIEAEFYQSGWHQMVFETSGLKWP